MSRSCQKEKTEDRRMSALDLAQISACLASLSRPRPLRISHLPVAVLAAVSREPGSKGLETPMIGLKDSVILSRFGRFGLILFGRFGLLQGSGKSIFTQWA